MLESASRGGSAWLGGSACSRGGWCLIQGGLPGPRGGLPVSGGGLVPGPRGVGIPACIEAEPPPREQNDK